MKPLTDGTWLCRIGNHGVAETGQNQLVTFSVQYIYTDAETQEEFGITGYHYLEKKDGTLNDRTINDLKNCFGWDGRDPSWLEDQAFDGVQVEVVVESEEYEGKSRAKVKWINPPGGGGGIQKGGGKAAGQKLGSKLRALNGGAPAATAPKPAGKPTPPAPAKTAAPKAPAKPPKPAKKTYTDKKPDDAWELFVTLNPGTSEDELNAKWFKTIGDEPVDWNKVYADLEAEIPY